MTSSAISKAGLLAFIAAAAIPLSSSAGEPVESKPITPESDCLVANHVSAWGVVHDKRLVVKSLGNRYYDIQLARSCPKLQQEHFLSFRNSPMPMRGNTTKPLICGNIGDAVRLTRGIEGTNNPCRISSIRRIDERTFEAVFGADSASADEMLDGAPTIHGGLAAND